VKQKGKVPITFYLYPFPLPPFFVPRLLRNASTTRGLLIKFFAAYLLVVAALTIVPTHVSSFSRPQSNHINLVPVVYSFTCFLQDQRAHPHLARFCLKNALGNIALFLPLGILLPLVSDRWRSLKRVVLLACCLSVSIETIQFFSAYIGSPRAVDIDDVLLNTLGACLGFVIYRYAIKRSVTADRPATSGLSSDAQEGSLDS
jgi:glycopeptide antibiotics resistance protein